MKVLDLMKNGKFYLINIFFNAKIEKKKRQLIETGPKFY